MRFLPFFAALFLACGFAGGGVDVDSRYQHKVELDPAGATLVSVEWHSGGIELVGDDGDSIRVTAVGRMCGGLVEPKEWLDMVSFRRETERVALEFTQPGIVCPYSVALEVRFPRGMAVDVANGSGALTISGGSSAVIELGSGGVTVTGVTGDVSVETASGGIVVEGVGGSLKVSSASGGLEINRVAGAVEAETASGGIEIGLGPDHAWPVNAETASGGITLSVGAGQAGAVSLHTGSGGIDLSYGGTFTGDADLGTGSGGITVDLTDPPEGLAIEAETSSGSVSTNLPGAAVFNRYGAGEIQLKGAGPKISLDTASGSIEVNVR
ncbi:MAG: hypothetical protein A2Y64_04350 [Candidatus Coatesbacteria bacterium RBG_13_66_14]|uniref:DUF4097 domain-containing protein n=1 Tax=Candidatus Coatesbacteria bacterium RBG_13_66_14 TaxID=1817816 RepID=A0A1F5F5A2_9BACT|nr:MAG: hypothetical protein A2Y64_04350 [Candidatus Coatesbacteria bacterium RBG_13_66_14]